MNIKKRIILILLVTLMCISSITISSFSRKTQIIYADEINESYVEHEVIVTCNDPNILNYEEYSILGQLEDSYIILIHDDTLSTEELINIFKDKEGIFNVEPNWEIEEVLNNEAEDFALLNSFIPNDYHQKDTTAYQWAMNNDGHMLGKGKGADMNYGVWKTQIADESLEKVVVAVIDCGVDASNEDIPMWSDPGNIGLSGTYPGADLHGYCEQGASSYEYLERDHGTHCAGIIAAKWNGEGISGVASNVEIMSVKHNDNFSSFIKCYQYVLEACKAGVNVRATSNSWGSGCFHSYILDSLVRELGEKYNVVSVFSAGNSYTDDDTISSNPSVMSDNPYAIVVGAYNPDGTRAEFSSYGQTTVDIFTPGTMILSTYLNQGSIQEVDYPYFPESDNNPVLRQSFDDESLPLQGDINITFNNLEGAYISDKLSFDGNKSLYIPANTLKDISDNYPEKILLSSDVVDLSSLAEKPKYLGFKILPIKSGRLDFNITNYTIPTTDEPYTDNFYDAFTTSANGWACTYINLEEIDNIDWENFYFTIAFNLQDESYRYIQDYDVYIDMISFGNEAVNYTYMSGTSMACPALVGEVALICGKYPTINAKEVVARVLCGTNQSDEYTFDGLCTTGEIANVDKALGNELTPYIQQIDNLDNAYIKIKGLFMDDIVSVLYRDENTNTFKEATIITKQGNNIIVKIDDSVKGNVDFILTNKYGKSPLKRTQIDINPNYQYYDNYDVPIPENVEELLDTWNTWTAQVYENDVYFFHQTAEDKNNPETIPSKFIRFNTDTKTFEIISFPEEILKECEIKTPIFYSGTTHDNKLCFFILGKEEGKEYADKHAIISLDCKGNWRIEEKIVDESIIRDQNFTLVDIDNEYALVGSAYLHSIMLWDEEKGQYVSKGTLDRRAPNALYRNGQIWVAGGTVAGLADETVSGVEYYELEKDSEEDSYYYNNQGNIIFDEFVTVNKDQYYGIASCAKGIIAVGQTSKDKKSDTYLIPISCDGTVGKAISLNIRAYDGPLYKPACATVNDTLYVLAATSNHKHVFSYTSLKKEKPTPTPSPKPRPYTPVPTSVN